MSISQEADDIETTAPSNYGPVRKTSLHDTHNTKSKCPSSLKLTVIVPLSIQIPKESNWNYSCKHILSYSKFLLITTTQYNAHVLSFRQITD